MNNYRIDPKHQFSKRLARWTAIFWYFYMTWLSVVVFMRPESALYCVYMGILVTFVMLLNVWAYTRNSIYEKGVFAMLDKAKIDLSLKSIATSTVSKKQEDESDDIADDQTEEGDDETDG